MTVLSRDDISALIADGYVAVRGAVPAGVADSCRQVIWSEAILNGL